MRSILLAIAATLAAGHAAAQHCWPSTVALLIRDANGAVLAPQQIDSTSYTPLPGHGADFGVGPVRIDVADSNERDGDTPVLAWQGRGDCRVDVREVVLRRGTTVMRLWMDLHVDTHDKPGPSEFLLETPPFGTGTWRLDVCALPAGETGRYAAVPGRWARVSDSGDPGTPPRAAQGCRNGAAR